jgi:hypothetical protein
MGDMLHLSYNPQLSQLAELQLEQELPSREELRPLSSFEKQANRDNALSAWL